MPLFFLIQPDGTIAPPAPPVGKLILPDGSGALLLPDSTPDQGGAYTQTILRSRLREY